MVVPAGFAVGRLFPAAAPALSPPATFSGSAAPVPEPILSPPAAFSGSAAPPPVVAAAAAAAPIVPAPAVAASPPSWFAAVADRTGFDWRGAGVTVHLGYHPQFCCHWGIYDYRSRGIWIGPSAFDNPTRLRYVLLHELGHAWQWATGHQDRLAADMAPWATGPDALEYNADCIATLWGARVGYYWSCPAEARAVVSRRLAGDWQA
jgi:hypothetical protein